MENVFEQVTIEQTAAGELLRLLGLAINDDVQGIGLLEIVRDCQFFRLQGLSGAEFGYALKVAGSELWIQAAGGAAKIDLTVLGLALIEQQARNAHLKSVGFQTRRRGLVRKAIKAGYQVDGYILRKKIDA